ncbi:DUF424 family protein [Candidatus Woesearchaeota archaeon]|nr:DUF424 family protein [Candidatus Woesearchaeota archaeon]
MPKPNRIAEKLIVKKHIAPDGRLVLAVCDEELLMQTLSEDDIVLDLSTDFYKGTAMEAGDASLLMKKAYIINLVGINSLHAAESLELVDKKNIITVSGIPHAQIIVTDSL